MNFLTDPELRWVVFGVLGLLIISSATGAYLKKKLTGEAAQKVVSNLNDRINAWWVMSAIILLALVAGKIGSVILFAICSFLALREYITLTPTKPSDHRSLFWSFFVILPVQFVLVGMNWYGMYSICIPVYAFLLIPIRSAMAGDPEKFLERTAKIQWGLMVCVYFVSYIPALLMLEIPEYDGQTAKLLFFLIFVVQISDVLQYVWGKCFGKHKVAPTISPSKTVEGLVGGVLSATLLGGCLYWITPFDFWQALGMSFVITVMGFFGGLTMSAIKRDRGVKDFGNLIAGHGGIMDRIDSLCFAAPVFFHLTRYYFT